MERKPDWLPGFPVLIYCNRTVIDMVTHSELILIGQLIVSILTLFVHIYNNKKK